MKTLILTLLAAYGMTSFAYTPLTAEACEQSFDRLVCYFDMHKQEDTRLNENYSEIRRVASKEFFAKVQVAQRKWMEYRDLNCAANRDMMNMIGENSGEWSCKATMTMVRADELGSIAGFLNSNTEGNERE